VDGHAGSIPAHNAASSCKPIFPTLRRRFKEVLMKIDIVVDFGNALLGALVTGVTPA
jgi:hypothetical protein